MTADEIRALMARDLPRAIVSESMRNERIAKHAIRILESRGVMGRLLRT